jgi:hypothetical protein
MLLYTALLMVSYLVFYTSVYSKEQGKVLRCLGAGYSAKSSRAC